MPRMCRPLRSAAAREALSQLRSSSPGPLEGGGELLAAAARHGSQKATDGSFQGTLGEVQWLRDELLSGVRAELREVVRADRDKERRYIDQSLAELRSELLERSVLPVVREEEAMWEHRVDAPGTAWKEGLAEGLFERVVILEREFAALERVQFADHARRLSHLERDSAAFAPAFEPRLSAVEEHLCKLRTFPVELSAVEEHLRELRTFPVEPRLAADSPEGLTERPAPFAVGSDDLQAPAPKPQESGARHSHDESRDTARTSSLSESWPPSPSPIFRLAAWEQSDSRQGQLCVGHERVSQSR